MLTAYYDLQTSPPTYDIVGFLMAAERARIRKGEDRVSINFLPGPNGGFREDSLWPHDVTERQKMLHRVAVPMARMLPSASEVVVWPKRPKQPEPWSIGFNCRLYGLRLFVDCMRDGIRPLRPSEDVAVNPKQVTITLREAEHWKPRNSNVREWIEAARQIKRLSYDVVIVRDALRCNDGYLTDAIREQESIPESYRASVDMEARAKLYRSSACNLFVNNGPAWFAMALDAPVLMLKPTVDGLMRTCSSDFFRSCGIPIGGQIPGVPSYQQIVWLEDTGDNIVQAFQRFASADSARAA